MRIGADDMTAYAMQLLLAAGLGDEKAASVVRRLVASELLGHRTHGLAWLPVYIQRLGNGTIAKSGEIEVVSDHASGFAWRANRLPGAFVMERAIANLLERDAPVLVGTIANCSHIGALQTYLSAFTDRGLLVQIAATDPSIASVAPFGGIDAVLTTNPIAMGIPTDGEPILIDQCTSVVSNAAVRPYAISGRKLPAAWLLDEEGHETDDPGVIQAGRSGTILPVGGSNFGYKGFGFGLMVEALALAMSGYGRHSAPETFGQSVFISSIDPAFFGGREAFLSETSHLVRAVHASRPVPGNGMVRLPGERAQALAREQRRDGLDIDSETLRAIAACGDNAGHPMPAEWLGKPST
jgi:L-lactate dehydrogenase